MKAWVCKILPHTLSDRLICGGLLAFVTAFEIRDRAPLDVLNPATVQGPLWFSLHVLSLSGLVLAASTSTIVGVRSIRRSGATRAGLTRTLAGLAICIALTITTAYASRLLSKVRSDFNATFGARSLVKLEQIVNRSDLSPEKHATWSRMYAQERYYVSGDLIDYVTPDGQTVRFRPTPDDVRSRHERMVLPVLLSGTAANLAAGPVLWIAVALISCALGLLTPVRNRS